MSKSEVVPESPSGPIYATTELGTPATAEYRQRAERESIESRSPEEHGIVADCAKYGWTINSVRDIAAAWTMARKDRCFDTRLLPMLTEHLSRGNSEMTMRGLILALSQPEAREFALEKFAEIFVLRQGSLGSMQADLAANGLVAMSTPADIELLKRLASDQHNSDIRVIFLPAIAKFGKASAIPFLRSLLNDKIGIAVEAANELSKLNDQASRGDIERLEPVLN